jgi:SAM-dependent methyltransferase
LYVHLLLVTFYNLQKTRKIEKIEKSKIESIVNNCLISREEIKKVNDKKVSILEIGPYFIPFFQGENVKYLDVLNKEDLIKHAKNDPNINTTENIPEIDYVFPEGDMSLINEKFDIVFSSHNIEHQVDLIRHLNQVANVLKENGKFYMFIPDERYCFDHYIPETPVSEVLAVNLNGTKVHSLQAILAMRCETTHNDPSRHWKGDHGQMDRDIDSDCYFGAVKEHTDAEGKYIDSHKWRFTPESFKYTINTLYKMGLINLEIDTVGCTAENSHEFGAILKKK